MAHLSAGPQVHEHSLVFPYSGYMSLTEFTQAMNHYGEQRIPFLFLVDFEMQKPQVFTLDALASAGIRFEMNGVRSEASVSRDSFPIILKHYPIDFRVYQKKFAHVMDHLRYGDSFLTNLTVKTRIDLSMSLTQLFAASAARYKLLYQDEFLTFSPESFVQIREQQLFAFPMKGTIDARIPDAAARILADEKEMAEHVTIVDLIRNDMSQVSRHVHVSRFRYLDTIRTQDKILLQVSSEITGDLPVNYREQLGDILCALLPAGSVSGAPKAKTLEIIREAEGEDRGYYTGVFGYFDGTNLDSAVMIRFIEHNQGEYYYRSGGGITTQSQAENEYQEVLDKIYVPVN
jgi:para-aminobenzoate synthetase component I